MQEDNSMSDRILACMERIIKSDRWLQEFSIVLVDENKNKSPVLYVNHNLGLESWCVKHVYRYAYTELFKVRNLLRKSRLPEYKMEQINKLLIGALLIQPDVSTFWNMRRELVENEILDPDDELLFSKLVLSHKSKSNEAFAYRKWLIRRIIKNMSHCRITSTLLMYLGYEFAVTQMAAENCANNYHAWSHRIWAIQNIAQKSVSDIIGQQLQFSFDWINMHVSEHSGYQYRQHLLKYIKDSNKIVAFNSFYKVVEENLGLCPSNSEFLSQLLGERENPFDITNPVDLLKNNNCVNYFCVLFYDLFYLIEDLIRIWPTHETIWYHRRFVIYNLLECAYEYHGLCWKPNVRIDDSCLLNSLDGNVVNSNVSSVVQANCKFQENGEKYPKLLKYEPDLVESSYLYKILLKNESNCIKDSTLPSRNVFQRQLAERHKKWLNVLVFFNLN